MSAQQKKVLASLAALLVLGGCQYSHVETFDKSVPRGWEYVEIKNMPAEQASTSAASHTQPQELKKYTLDARNLFATGKADLSVKGTAQVQTAAGEISNNLPVVRQVNVIGYTDPVGSAEANQALSLKRAESVAAVLQKDGIPANIIRTEGRGSQDLVVSDCAERFKSDKNGQDACNQPNRRVVISVIGMPSQPGVPTFLNSSRNQAPTQDQPAAPQSNPQGWEEQVEPAVPPVR